MSQVVPSPTTGCGLYAAKPVKIPEAMAQRLSGQQIARLWVQEGGNPRYANLMARIALRESGGDPYARHVNTNGTVDRGLFQVNSIWGGLSNRAMGDPVAATRAAIHILKVQGPKAWATYNPSTDRKYLGGFHGASHTASPGMSPSPVDPGGDGLASLIAQLQGQRPGRPAGTIIQAPQFTGSRYFTPIQPGMPKPSADSSLSDLLSQASQLAPNATVPTGGQMGMQHNGSGGATLHVTGVKGIARFEGKPVAGWIAPILEYARKHGWAGSVTSGFRSYADQKRIYDSGVRPAARPGTSNHEGTKFPRGAVDVSDAQQLARIIQHSPYAHTLIYAGGKDPVHFSHPHNGGY